MNIKFSTHPRWNGAGQNSLSFATGQVTADASQQFSEKQIKAVLHTLKDLPAEKWGGKENFLKEAAKDSVLIEVVRGVHDANNPHLMVDFLGKIYHINLEMNGNGNWTASAVPPLKRLLIEEENDLDEAMVVLEGYRNAKEDDLFSQAKLTGAGIGYAVQRQRDTQELAYGVFVMEKMSPSKCSSEAFIGSFDTFYSPDFEQYYMIRIDVRKGGKTVEEACDPDTKLRVRVNPIESGVSISNASLGTSGTLGGFFFYKRIATVMLSNNHVLKLPSQESDKNIVQPGRLLGGAKPKDTIGFRFLNSTKLDAALANTNAKGRTFKYQMACTGSKVRTIAAPTLNLLVRKVGAKSGLTSGKVTMLKYKDSDFPQYGKNNILAQGVPSTTPFTIGGDSGSLYESSGSPETFVALHWGGFTSGMTKMSIGHPLPTVASDLQLTPTVSALPEVLVEESLRQMAEGSGNTLAERKLRFPNSSEPQPFYYQFFEALRSTFGSSFSEKGSIGQSLGYAMTDTLLDPDGWRAAVVALTDIFADKITSQEILSHVLSHQDITNLRRFLQVVGETQGMEQEVEALMSFVGSLQGSELRMLANGVPTMKADPVAAG